MGSRVHRRLWLAALLVLSGLVLTDCPDDDRSSYGIHFQGDASPGGSSNGGGFTGTITWHF